ncbi:hypothetical protein FJZ41_01450 [Candidatus Shapirobacteria bacterium]|nr:hypothetical protein [Candidatus Shapirobacteria bacterium]
MLKKFLIVVFSLFVFAFLKTDIWAVTVSEPKDLPAEVAIGQSFNLNGEIIGFQNGEKYFVKCRLGLNSSSLNEGQTYNILSNSWLGDTSPWVEMPTVESANFSLSCRVKEGVEAGNKIVYLRACLRQVDGGCSGSFQSATGTNLITLVGSTPTPTLTSTPTPTTQTPTPTATIKPTATYKINEVKDEDGEVLNSVKVYVDEVYLHHYAPEVLTFGDGYQCDTYVSCGFGQHTIKLEKTGYNHWEETLALNPGDFYETSPVMIFSQGQPTTTNTPTPTKNLTSPTPTSKISLTPTLKSKTAILAGEILGETATFTSFYPFEATLSSEEQKESSPSAKNTLRPKIFLSFSLLVVFLTAFWVWFKVWYTQPK